MRNKLTDLNNHLFAQLERLSEEGLSREAIEHEVRRTKAIVRVSDQIVKGAGLQLKAAELIAEHGIIARQNLPMIENKAEPGK